MARPLPRCQQLLLPFPPKVLVPLPPGGVVGPGVLWGVLTAASIAPLALGQVLLAAAPQCSCQGSPANLAPVSRLRSLPQGPCSIWSHTSLAFLATPTSQKGPCHLDLLDFKRVVVLVMLRAP